MSKSEEDFQASICVLNSALSMYESGLKDSYRIVATELRKLLCDRNPLLPRIFPDFKLHKLHMTEVLEKSPSLAEGMQIMALGRLSVNSGGTDNYELLFAKSLTLMKPSEWLQQPLLSPSITIWELIKSVADKEGAHSDPDYNETLLRAKILKYVQDDSHIPTIVAIGKYLVAWLHDSDANNA